MMTERQIMDEQSPIDVLKSRLDYHKTMAEMLCTPKRITHHKAKVKEFELAILALEK